MTEELRICRLAMEVIIHNEPNYNALWDLPGYDALHQACMAIYQRELAAASSKVKSALTGNGGSPDHPQRKLKITEVGQPCRDCQTPVIRKEHRKPPKYKGQSFYYAYWFHCPGCKKDFFVNEAAVMFDAPGTLPTQHKAPQTHIGPVEARFDAAAIGDGVAPW